MIKNAMDMSAKDLAASISRGEVSSSDAVRSSLERIATRDERLQAFIGVDAKGALVEAELRDTERRAGQIGGPLHGVPVAVKDITRTAGLRTTWGSCLMEETVPEFDDEPVRRLRQAGAVIVGKTNTPEFGFGAVCTNRLRGPTANPWDLSLTSGGSSGGSAVAVTAGLVPLAHGTDFGGSVRTPASFCGCVGFRPTPGVIADPQRPQAWSMLATHGSLARTVDDAALMVSVMAGRHRYDPTSLLLGFNEEGGDARDVRVAVSPTLGDAFRIDPDVRACFEEAVKVISSVFPNVTTAAPDMKGASDAFKTLRAAVSWRAYGDLVENNADRLTGSFVWNVRRGRTISADEYLKAEEVRSRTYRNAVHFFENIDVLALPAASVLPFPNAQMEVGIVDGVSCETIIDYLACTYLISLIGFPSISIPAVWTDNGVPFGIQLVAPPYAEACLLSVARRLEQAGFSYRAPPAITDA